MKVVHSWLKEYVGDSLPSPEKVEELLTFHSFEVEGIEEVEGESVIDVDVLPNRSSDCLCHRGIAREIASLLNVELQKDPLRTNPELRTTDKISITIEDSSACPRFTAALISGIEIKESPAWLQKRLKAIGQRSINNIVDATNYVMYALGEPLHAYDADLFPQVEGQWKFVVRNAKVGEKVSLLAEGGKDKMSAEGRESALGYEDRIVECLGTELLIVDGSTDRPIGLAGVKGGQFAGVHSGTKNIIIEAAHFNPVTTRKTARRLGIVIDASKRFENEPSRDLPPFAQAEIISLIKDIAGGTFEGYVDEYLEKKLAPAVKVTTQKSNALLGLQLDDAEIVSLLGRIGAAVVAADGQCVATGPWERTDLLIEEDFIEEVGRLYGLDKIESIIPAPTLSVLVNKRQYYTDLARSILTELGFFEVITSSFHKKGDIQLHNALASDKSYVRGNLRQNIETVLDKNFTNSDLLGVKDIRVFEIGTVFTKEEGSVSEHVSIAIGVRTKGNGYSPQDDKTINTATSALADIGIALNWVAEKGAAEANFSSLIETLPSPDSYSKFEKKENITYKPVSVYPASARDIALWVSVSEDSEMVAKVLMAAAGPLLVRHDLFDTFTKDDRTSYAFRFVFQSFERTLTDGEVTEAMDAVYKVAKDSGWEVR